MKKPVLLVLAGLVLIPGCWPRRRVIVPEWRLTVLQNGRPVARAMVHETWRDYSVQVGSEERRYTDAAGRVVFPERAVHAPPIYRALGCALQVFQEGVHFSCGPSAYASAYWQKSEGWVGYQPGNAPPGTIELEEH